MRWSEFQDTAARLAQGTTEGDWRSAVSRSYYATFHYFREFLLSHGLSIGRGAQCHFNLYVGLLHCGIAPMTDIARRLDDLRRARVDADYDLRVGIDQFMASEVEQDCRDMIGDFQELLTVVPAVQIVDGARRHLQAIGRLGPP